jgi:hypothetical protein
LGTLFDKRSVCAVADAFARARLDLTSPGTTQHTIGDARLFARAFQRTTPGAFPQTRPKYLPKQKPARRRAERVELFRKDTPGMLAD